MLKKISKKFMQVAALGAIGYGSYNFFIKEEISALDKAKHGAVPALCGILVGTASFLIRDKKH